MARSSILHGRLQVLVATILLGGLCSGLMARCDAQEEAPPALEGYINAVHLPNGFEVNGEHVSILPTIHYGSLDDIAVTTTNPDPLRAALQVGVYVRVIGRVDETTHSVMASTMFFRDDWDKPLAGFGLIVKVDSSGAGPILEADGYSIRITAATKTSFGDGLKGLTDVGPGMGLLYEGRRGKDGVLLATAASFSIAHTEARKSNDNQYAIRKKGRTVHADQFLNADGTLKNPDSISIPDSPVQIFGSAPQA